MNRKGASALNLLGWLVALIVLGAIVAAFLIVGSPAQARRERADESRVSKLENLARSVHMYYQKKGSLPKKQEDALGYNYGYTDEEDLKDPETGELIGYRVVDKDHFELSAKFETDQSHSRSAGYYYGDERFPFWKHKAGRQSFRLEAKASGNY